MILGIHHFAIIISSASYLSFYEKLGFHEFFRKKRQYDTVVLMYGHGIQIEVFIDPRHPPRDSKMENLGLRHLALRVDDIERTSKELNLEMESVKLDWTGVNFCFIKDPDGNILELHE